MRVKGQRKKIKNNVSNMGHEILNEITIEYLNDDCLIYIFSFLSIRQKLEVEWVCKRWSEVAKRSWNHVHDLDLSSSALPCKKDKDFKKNKAFVTNVFKRCSTYVNKLLISKPCYDIFPEMWKKLLQNCKYVRNLCIDDSFTAEQMPRYIFSDKEISLLLDCFTDLHSIFLIDLELEGKFITSLNTNDNLKIFSIKNCSFDNTKYFCDFLSKLKSINNLEIVNACWEQINGLISELIKSECNNISEVSIRFLNQGKYDHTLHLNYYLSNFISNQKKMIKIELIGLTLNTDVIGSLPESLEVLNLYDSNFVNVHDSMCNLGRLQNLKIITFFLEYFHEYFLKVLTKSLNTDTIEISIYYQSILIDYSEPTTYFSKFKKLESFSIQYRNPYSNSNRFKDKIDCILKDLSNCSQLRKIKINNCNFTSLGLKSISSLKNLVSLKIDGFNPLNDEMYNNFVRDSSSLKELIVCGDIKYKSE